MHPGVSIALCWLCGAAMGGCLLFPAAGPAVFLLAAPALALIGQAQGRRRVWRCAGFALGLCMIGYLPAFCIRPPLEEALIPWVDAAVYVVACLAHGSLLTAALWGAQRLPGPAFWRTVVWTPLLWTLAEWLCGAGPFAWPTLRLSLALWQYPALIQLARWGGQLSVSLLIMLANGLLAQALCRPVRQRIAALCAALLLLVGNGAYGLLLPDPAPADTSVAVVQPGVSVVGDNRGDVLERSLELAKEAAVAAPALMLLPESVLPSDFVKNTSLQASVGEIAATAGADLLVGGRLDSHSAVFHLGPDGTLQDRYQKRREVPFFENGVGKREFRWLPDNRAGLLSAASGHTLGVMICYESLFSAMSRYAAGEGADLLVVLTNDSWFAAEAAKDLHLAGSVYRAVETGRTLVQAGLNGHTAVVDATGRITAALPNGEGGVLNTAVSLTAQNTPYLRWGDGWLWLCACLPVAALLHRRIWRKKQQ